MRTFLRFWLRRNRDRGLDKNVDFQVDASVNRYGLSPEEVAGLWNRIQRSGADNVPVIEKRSMARYWWFAAAAAVVAIAITSVVVLRTGSEVEYRTRFGETRTIVLPDRSTVILNANSTVTFKKNWDHNTAREIHLDGEAYFSVVHQANNQSFTVRTPGGVAIQVLGTTFTVYHREVDTKVVLNTGAISLSYPADRIEKKIMMKPGDLVEFSGSHNDQFVKRQVDPRIYAAWTEGKIILNQTSLREIIRMAKDNYGVEIDVQSDAMLDQTVSGSMPVGDPESFVSQVARAFQLKVARANDKYLLIE